LKDPQTSVAPQLGLALRAVQGQNLILTSPPGRSACSYNNLALLKHSHFVLTSSAASFTVDSWHRRCIEYREFLNGNFTTRILLPPTPDLDLDSSSGVDNFAAWHCLCFRLKHHSYAVFGDKMCTNLAGTYLAGAWWHEQNERQCRAQMLCFSCGATAQNLIYIYERLNADSEFIYVQTLQMTNYNLVPLCRASRLIVADGSLGLFQYAKDLTGWHSGSPSDGLAPVVFRCTLIVVSWCAAQSPAR
jgi:hypothetical protein